MAPAEHCVAETGAHRLGDTGEVLGRDQPGDLLLELDLIGRLVPGRHRAVPVGRLPTAQALLGQLPRLYPAPRLLCRVGRVLPCLLDLSDALPYVRDLAEQRRRRRLRKPRRGERDAPDLFQGIRADRQRDQAG